MRDDSAELRYAASLVGRDAGSVLSANVPADAISERPARALYRAVLAVCGAVATPVADDVIAELTERQELALVGGPEQVHILAALYGSEEPLSLRREVLRGACLRTLREASATLHGAATSGRADDAAAVLADALQAVQRFNASGNPAPMLHAGEHLEVLIEDLDAIARGKRERKAEAQLGPLTPCLGLPQPGALVVIGGYSHAGKSFLMQHLERCYHAIGIGTLRLSLEDPDVVNRARLASEMARMSVSPQQPSQDEARALVAKLVENMNDGYSRGTPRLVHTPDSRDVYAVMRAMRRGVEERGCRVVFVDYAQIVSVPHTNDARAAVAATVGLLKSEAIRLGVTLVLGSQLRKPTHTDQNAEPSAHDLKDASELHHAAEVLLLCWREDHGTDEKPEFARLVRVAKDKLSGTNCVALCVTAPGGVVDRVVEMRRSPKGKPEEVWNGRIFDAAE
jgi:replicative DNA helicase